MRLCQSSVWKSLSEGTQRSGPPARSLLLVESPWFFVDTPTPIRSPSYHSSPTLDHTSMWCYNILDVHGYFRHSWFLEVYLSQKILRFRSFPFPHIKKLGKDNQMEFTMGFWYAITLHLLMVWSGFPLIRWVPKDLHSLSQTTRQIDTSQEDGPRIRPPHNTECIVMVQPPIVSWYFQHSGSSVDNSPYEHCYLRPWVHFHTFHIFYPVDHLGYPSNPICFLCGEGFYWLVASSQLVRSMLNSNTRFLYDIMDPWPFILRVLWATTQVDIILDIPRSDL